MRPSVPSADGNSSTVKATRARALSRPVADYIDFAAYRQDGGYRVFQGCAAGEYDARRILAHLRDIDIGDDAVSEPDAPAHRVLRLGIDASGPEGFKDCVLLACDPHRFIEGMLIAAWAHGASEVCLDLRDDDHECRETLQHELETVHTELPVAGLPVIQVRRGIGPPVEHRLERLFGLRMIVESGGVAPASAHA